MSRLMSKSTGFVVLLLCLLTVVVAQPSFASTAGGNPAYCDSAVEPLTNLDIQDEVPVILVYGFKGRTDDWGVVTEQASFAGMVNSLPGVTVAHLFNYSTGFWVDHPDNGPKLAKTIDCVAKLSLQNGGKGKVVVVGYSMGGLVARDALSRRSTDGQRAIADEVGQVITIGTPHVGILPNIFGVVPFTLLSAFMPGSGELSRLPHFPSQTVVHTIAGDVERVYYNKRGNEVKRERPYDDTLVTTQSANAEYSIDVSKGGGETTISCQKRYNGYGRFGWYRADKQAAPCEHSQLISNAGNGVREDTVNAIGKYVASLASTSLIVGNLTTAYDSRWGNVYHSVTQEGGGATDTTNGIVCTNCSPTLTRYAQVFLYAYGEWCSGPVETCARYTSYTHVGPAPAVTIGGRTPDYSAHYVEYNYGFETYIWCFSDQKLCMDYSRLFDTGVPQLEPSQALLDVFSSATWSN
jgi:pimeloyl-ACP methyl ester carboxylesterase